MPATPEEPPVSRKLLAFLVSELATVRVICQSARCGAVVEVPVGNLAARYPAPVCPLCQAEFSPWKAQGADNPLARLGTALAAVRDLHEKVQVEFVLPDEG
jgi:hypothetical protein